ncbi:hypothetical protein HK104_001701 [Borealophlyctis nickersoniae]|nr:hypothetical protein HK104_001701 [Borealophlyctis nickersoniae]
MAQATQTLKKWFDHLEKREVGHETVDRKTGNVVPERQPLLKNIHNRLLFNPVMDVIDQTNAARSLLATETIHEGHEMNQTSSAKNIEEFVKFHEINMDWFEPSDIHAFKTFNDFFTRNLKPGARPIAAPNDPTVVVSAADCRIVVYDTVQETTKIWVKGSHFTIGALIEDEEQGNWQAKKWANGSFASFRLSPQDYHHYHAPVAGKVEWFKSIPGTYYGVDPRVTNSSVNNLCANARSVICLSSPTFGKVLYVAVGAEEVGTVTLSDAVKHGAELKKGDEMGHFSFGGSNVVVVFEEGKVVWDEDLVRFSREKLEANVKMGERIGKAK